MSKKTKTNKKVEPVKAEKKVEVIEKVVSPPTEKKNSLKKSELVARIAEASGCSKAEINKIISVYNDTVVKAVCEGYCVTLPGIGTFSTTERAEQTCTLFGKKKVVPAHKSVKFKVSKAFKDSVK